MPPQRSQRNRDPRRVFKTNTIVDGAPAANTRGRKTGRNQGESGRRDGKAATEGQPELRIQWETDGVERTSKMVRWLVDHPADFSVLFPEDKEVTRSQNRTHVTKQEIYEVLALIVFKHDIKYGESYAAVPDKFRDAVCSRLEYLKSKYSEFAGRFVQTGNGVGRHVLYSGPRYENILQQVLEQFPWYTDLHGLWKSIPSYSAEVVTFTREIPRGAALVQKPATPQTPAVINVDSSPHAALSSPNLARPLITHEAAVSHLQSGTAPFTPQKLAAVDKGKSAEQLSTLIQHQGGKELQEGTIWRIEAETELLEPVMEPIDAPYTGPGNGNKLKIPFSAVTWADLSKMGVQPARPHPELQGRVSAPTIDPRHIEHLAAQITQIRCTVGMMPECGPRMIFAHVLHTITNICLDSPAKLSVAVLHGMQITAGDGVMGKNPQTQFEVWLNGTVGYVVCSYEHERDCAELLQAPLDKRRWSAKNYIILAEASYELFLDTRPEATSQAIALSQVIGIQTIPHCFSDGCRWWFGLYTRDDDGNHLTHAGPLLTIVDPLPDDQQPLKMSIQRLLQALYHWLTIDGDQFHRFESLWLRYN